MPTGQRLLARLAVDGAPVRPLPVGVGEAVVAHELPGAEALRREPRAPGVGGQRGDAAAEQVRGLRVLEMSTRAAASRQVCSVTP